MFNVRNAHIVVHDKEPKVSIFIKRPRFRTCLIDQVHNDADVDARANQIRCRVLRTIIVLRRDKIRVAKEQETVKLQNFKAIDNFVGYQTKRHQ